ncbi:MAG TPA: hypothetical protein VIM00_09460 [Candidatus Acidoferrum sp.]|jgi:hypothetical protein
MSQFERPKIAEDPLRHVGPRPNKKGPESEIFLLVLLVLLVAAVILKFVR